MNNETPWPNIKKLEALGTDNTDTKVSVPMKEIYSFADMAYLDSQAAKPIFETQANIIIARKSTGIIDVGCRHGPVVQILYDKGYTDFEYMGFDTSPEPIEIGKNLHSNKPNIEYRCCSWNDRQKIKVNFDVDMVIWSGVLLYNPDKHFEFFDSITREFYKSTNAIIQEPMSDQRIWDERLYLKTITDDLDQYKRSYAQFNEKVLDLDLFAGKRLIADIVL
jgi:SAM-dependent methyltransferase